MSNKLGITIFCASSVDTPQQFVEAARQLGQLIAQSGLPLITGAGRMGLMGAANNAAIEAGGYTIGVIPQFMVERGWQHDGLSELIVTQTMHERKETMARLSRASIAIPGGFGTLDELMDIATARQLGLYNGHVIVLDIDNYYEGLRRQLERGVADKIIRGDHLASLIQWASTPEEAMAIALSPATEPHLSPKF